MVTHGWLLCKIICRSSDKPLKSEILTFRSYSEIFCKIIRGKFWLPWIILQKGMLFWSMICGKFWLPMNYPAESHAFPQDSVRKVKTFHGFQHGKACLLRRIIRDYMLFHGNPWKVLTFRELYPGKACLSVVHIIRRKFWLSADNPKKLKFRAQISPRNSRKNIKLLLDIHQEPIRCCLMKKKRPKNLMLRWALLDKRAPFD